MAHVPRCAFSNAGMSPHLVRAITTCLASYTALMANTKSVEAFTFGGQPLIDDFSEHPNATVASAYNICRTVELNLLDKLKSPCHPDSIKELEKSLINVRILGHLLSYGPSETAITEVTRAIISADNQTCMVEGLKD
jgi:hypothetical protein